MLVDVRGRCVRFDAAISRNVVPSSTAGLPGVVLLAGLSRSRLPVSLVLDGPPGTDRAFLVIGLAIERELGALPPPADSHELRGDVGNGESRQC